MRNCGNAGRYFTDFCQAEGVWDRRFAAARSYHAGGVNAALADGSVRFFTDGISSGTWRALGTMSNGEVPGSDS